MSKLISFVDTKNACWSRVNLDSDEPIWISVSQSGVLVKRSKLGIFGSILFKGVDVIESGDVARNLSEVITEYSLPEDMHNIVLKSFTQSAINSHSSVELCEKIALAKKYDKVSGVIEKYSDIDFKDMAGDDFVKFINDLDNSLK